jgi:hypothetical protein
VQKTNAISVPDEKIQRSFDQKLFFDQNPAPLEKLERHSWLDKTHLRIPFPEKLGKRNFSILMKFEKIK